MQFGIILKMVTTLLIDLDNTLVDFNKCAEYAMRTYFPKFGLEYKENMIDIFIKTNDSLWKKIEKGELTKNRLREIRWNLVFENLGLSGDGPAFEEIFENSIANTAFPVDGAEDILKYLSEKYTLCIVTNGFEKVQTNRMKISGFDRFFKHIFISEKIGHQKPSKEFFDGCFSELGNPKKDDVVLIGDSLSADIKGGVSYGIKTVWFDRKGETPSSENTPDYTVHSLEEIKNIL